MKDNYIVPDMFTGLERKNVLKLHDAFMANALVWSLCSKDPSTQVGAVIVNPENRQISAGYNGTPIGWKDSEFPWGKGYAEIAKEFEKYGSVVHAEMNAIKNHNGRISDFKDATVYVTLFPCSNCAKLLTQFGIKKVIYYSDKYKDTDDNRIAKRIFEYCGVEYEQYKSETLQRINVSLEDENLPEMIKKDELSRKRK